jgi:hypothetical protein
MRNVRTRVLLSVAIAAVIGINVVGQGTLQFQNLDFEAAQLIPIPGDPNGAVPFAAAFPGWTGYIGGQQISSTIPNGVPIGFPGQTPFIAIMSPPDWGAHQGFYELGYGSSVNSTAAIAQTGQVPAQAKSLQFLALYAPTVTLGGVTLSALRLGSGPGASSFYGVDISAFAGQQHELRFQTGLSINYLDAITFSTQVIPEPGTLGLFGLGAVLIGWRLRRSS